MESKSIKKQESGTFEFVPSPTIKKPFEIFSGTDKSLKLVSISTEEARISLFGSTLSAKIMKEQRLRLSRQNTFEDMLLSFPGLVIKWKKLQAKLNKSSEELLNKILPYPSLSECYISLINFFKSLVDKLKSLTSSPTKAIIKDKPKAFNDELVLMAALGIHHTNTVLLGILDQHLDSADFGSQLQTFSEHFSSLEVLHEFFFALTRLKCNTVLHERHLAILQDSTKMTLSTLQIKLKADFKLIVGTPIQAKKLYIIATLIYCSIRTIALLSVFGEPEELTKSKYQNILERFKAVFVLMSQSVVFDKIFCEYYAFEPLWSVSDSRYMLTSFNQKRLTLFFQEDKMHPEEPIEFNLKYLVVYYNYKILKLISQRLQVAYDEHILNIFSSLIHKNRSILNELLSKKNHSLMKVMVYLNENTYIIKSYITNLAYFSDNLDPMQRQAKYDTIKDTTIDCLSLAVKMGMYWKPKSISEINELTIYHPKDFIALLFKSLLLFKKIKGSTKFSNEMIKHVNILASDLISRAITTDDPLCFHLYKLYLLQFLSSWEPKDLGEKYMKYSEEMSRYLGDYNEGEFETDITKHIKTKKQELALKLYVGLAQIDFNLPIETIIGLIRENFTNEKKLYRYFYTMTCLFARDMISSKTFESMMQEDEEALRQIFGDIKSNDEFDAFTRNEGMNILFLIYKNIACSLMQTKEQKKEYQIELSKSGTRKSIATEEVNDYLAENYLKKLDDTIQAYSNLLNMTGAFICALNYIVSIAKDFLVNPEFNHDFYEKVMHMSFGRSLILRLFKIFNKHLLINLKEQDLIDKYLTLVTDSLMNLSTARIAFEEEKKFILTIVSYLQTLIEKSVNPLINYRELIKKK